MDVYFDLLGKTPFRDEVDAQYEPGKERFQVREFSLDLRARAAFDKSRAKQRGGGSTSPSEEAP